MRVGFTGTRQGMSFSQRRQLRLVLGALRGNAVPVFVHGGAIGAAEALISFTRAGGARLAYVGAPEDGCTADDRFFALLDVGWTLVREVGIPNWLGVRDRLWLYEQR